MSILLCAALGLSSHQLFAQTNDGAAAGARSASQPQTLGDLARKSKQKQQDQAGNPAPANKPTVYTEDNVPAPRGGVSQSTKPDTTAPPAKPETKPQTMKLAGNKAAITMFKPERSTVTRPSSTQVDWQIQNTSDYPTSPPYGPFTFTLTFTVTGPCNYNKTESETVDLMIGEGRADNMLANAFFFASDCAGEYYLALRVTSGGKLLNSARATMSVL
jgi:hypothetical protein